jgi:hypothetical protein
MVPTIDISRAVTCESSAVTRGEPALAVVIFCVGALCRYAIKDEVAAEYYIMSADSLRRCPTGNDVAQGDIGGLEIFEFDTDDVCGGGVVFGNDANEARGASGEFDVVVRTGFI